MCVETWGALGISARQGLKWGTGARICDGGWGVAPATLKRGLETLCLLLALLPDPQLGLGHPSPPGLWTSRWNIPPGSIHFHQGHGSFSLHSQGLARCVVYSKYHKVLAESKKRQSRVAGTLAMGNLAVSSPAPPLRIPKQP